MPPVLSGTNLSKAYGRNDALRGATIEVFRGESVAVMGPSGSGKSTLLYCLAGVFVPDGGEVVFDGSRVDTLPDAGRSDLRLSRFGFVFQFAGLLPELSAEENVALPLILAHVPRREAISRARRLLDAVALAGLGERRPGALSGGQAQRVAIARALVTEPTVVFADEPTGALDTETGEETMSLLLSSVRDRNAALVLVTHDEHIAGRCDRLVRVEDGTTAGMTC